MIKKVIILYFYTKFSISTFFQVFLKDGKLHFIPVPSNPAEITVYTASTPTLKQAYHLLASSLKTAANEHIQNAIQRRISR